MKYVTSRFALDPGSFFAMGESKEGYLPWPRYSRGERICRTRANYAKIEFPGFRTFTCLHIYKGYTHNQKGFTYSSTHKRFIQTNKKWVRRKGRTKKKTRSSVRSTRAGKKAKHELPVMKSINSLSVPPPSHYLLVAPHNRGGDHPRRPMQ